MFTLFKSFSSLCSLREVVEHVSKLQEVT